MANATGLLHAYLDATGYWGARLDAYPVTGDFAQWSEALGTPTIEVELSDHVDPEVERNLGGVLAVLDSWRHCFRAIRHTWIVNVVLARLRLIPHDDRFFDLFNRSADNILEGAQLLNDLLTTYVDVDRKARHLKDIEHPGDEIRTRSSER